RRVMDRLTLDEAVALRQEIADALQSGVAEAQHAAQARLGELARQLERQAGDHPVLATIGSWLAGFSGEETRRTSWRRRREGPPRGGRAPAAAGRRPARPGSARSPRSGSAGTARSARSRRRTPSSGGRSSR